MQALISLMDSKGHTQLGSDDKWFSNHYQTEHTFNAYAFKHIPDGAYKVEFFWDSLLGRLKTKKVNVCDGKSFPYYNN